MLYPPNRLRSFFTREIALKGNALQYPLQRAAAASMLGSLRLRMLRQLRKHKLGRMRCTQRQLLADCLSGIVVGAYVLHAQHLEAFPLGNDSIVECHVRLSSPQFSHFKTGRSPLRHKETLAVAIGRYENVVAHFGANGLGKGCIELDAGNTTA